MNNAREFKLVVANGSNNLAIQMNLLSKEGWDIEGTHQVTHYLDKDDKDVFQYTHLMSRIAEDE